MKAFLFPGQGAQFVGMAKDLYDDHAEAKRLMELANELLGYRLTDIMFNGPEEELKRTENTQPAIFLHSVVLVKLAADSFKPNMVAGHSLGEFSALVANGVLSFEDGLKLVRERALAMQAACDIQTSTMAAVLGMEDEDVERICAEVNEVVVPANYNCPGQLVISGSVNGVETACEKLKEAGAKRALVLNVAGAFHSPLMEPARERLARAIDNITFHEPSCPIYQNVTADAVMDKEIVKNNLVAQLTAPVKWTQTMKQMLKDGANEFSEVGPGKVLQGLLKKVDREAIFINFTDELSSI